MSYHRIQSVDKWTCVQVFECRVFGYPVWVRQPRASVRLAGSRCGQKEWDERNGAKEQETDTIREKIATRGSGLDIAEVGNDGQRTVTAEQD